MAETLPLTFAETLAIAFLASPLCGGAGEVYSNAPR